MITYSDIYEASRKERYSDQLQPLLHNFIIEVRNYLEEKKQIALKENTEFSEVITATKKQIENAQMLFRELIRSRKKKIMNLILIASETGISKKDFDNMLDFEKKLFENLMESVEASDKEVKDLLRSKIGIPENKNVLFKEDVGEFVGLDGNKVGPFKKGEKIKIEKQIAKILVDDNKAEMVEE